MRDTMFNFFIDIFTEIVPSFLMAEPICYIFGIIVGVAVVGLFSRLLGVAR